MIRIQISRWRRLVTWSKVRELGISTSKLSIFTRRGNRSIPLDSVEAIECHSGLFWHTLRLRIRQEGRDDWVSIRGIGKESATRFMKAWGVFGHADRLIDAFQDFERLFRADAYFTHHAFSSWMMAYGHLRQYIAASNLDFLPADLCEAVQRLQQIFKDGRELVSERNDHYVERLLGEYKAWFDTQEKFPLTRRQREAIAIDEINCLAVAGAGTGKTSVVIGKVGFILERKLFKPEEVLLLAFSRKAKTEIEERILSKFNAPLQARTFHSLGLEIVAIEEIEDASYRHLVSSDRVGSTAVRCSRCSGGLLVLRKGNFRPFWGCSNYPFCDATSEVCFTCKEGVMLRNEKVFVCSRQGCGETAPICPECGQGMLIVKQSRYGLFFGCSNWRSKGISCTYTEDICFRTTRSSSRPRAQQAWSQTPEGKTSTIPETTPHRSHNRVGEAVGTLVQRDDQGNPRLLRCQPVAYARGTTAFHSLGGGPRPEGRVRGYPDPLHRSGCDHATDHRVVCAPMEHRGHFRGIASPPRRGDPASVVEPSHRPYHSLPLRTLLLDNTDGLGHRQTRPASCFSVCLVRQGARHLLRRHSLCAPSTVGCTVLCRLIVTAPVYEIAAGYHQPVARHPLGGCLMAKVEYEYGDELESWMAWNFQSFQKVRILTV